MAFDAIYEIDQAVSEPCVIVDLQTKAATEIPVGTDYSDLLVPVFRKGDLVYQVPELRESRKCTRQQLSNAPSEILKLHRPRPYIVGLEKSLHELRSTLLVQAKQQSK